MNKPAVSLDLIQIASPCHVSWDEMKGDDRTRFCGQCKLHVYNLSEMPREDAEALIAKREGRTCVRFFRRQDGTVLTRDCPVGLRALRQRLVRTVAALAGMLLTLATGTLFAGRMAGSGAGARGQESSIFARWIQPQPEIYPLMGDIVVPISPPAPNPPPLPPGTSP